MQVFEGVIPWILWESAHTPQLSTTWDIENIQIIGHLQNFGEPSGFH